MTKYSVLDLCPVVEGATPADAFRNSRDLAQHVERLGYERFWLAEHHGMPGVASAATSIVISHVAAGTSTIRVGAGGIMLPNHAPLVIAEQFGTLASLYPGRVELGLGRAPGTDQMTARALRRHLDSDADEFPRDVMELINYFREPEPNQYVRAIPGEGTHVPVWILGSSLFGASLAAALGLPFAFASHFAPAQMMQAIDIYRSKFKPSEFLEKSYLMLGYNVFAAPTDAEARLLASSMQQAFIAIRTGRSVRLQPPIENFQDMLGPSELYLLEQTLDRSAIGSPETVRSTLEDFVGKTGADEVMIASQIYDHDLRKRSYAIAAEATGLIAPVQEKAP
ncbi:LLM class flavin-dependent oxidoreductase [Emcibacter sp. SYSU 3D8]|uniref:LLM class flavin-dependent oxidoreductase n=1 Tax=Emcibacter sp. SYSU 3D8 TaxID=3133969 RepID=UPI0031FF2ABA